MDENISQDLLDLFVANDRLKTMADWTSPFADKRLLADAGFFYIRYANTKDLIRCPCCCLEISSSTWETGTNPTEIHSLLSPGCVYINQIESPTPTDCQPSGSEQSMWIFFQVFWVFCARINFRIH